MKVLSGVYGHGLFGRHRVPGPTRHFRGIKDSEEIGIIIIHQELALVPQLSIAENIFLGNEPSSMGVIDGNTRKGKTRETATQVALKESLTP